jgi:transposase
MKKKWYVGIDVSKKTLDVAVYDSSERLKDKNHIKVFNTKEGYKEMLSWFRGRKMKLREILICMEHTGIYSYECRIFLEQYNIDYSMENPLNLKRSIGISRGKNDKIDSYRIACYCYLHRDLLKLSKMPSHTLLQLKKLLNERKQYVKQRIVCKQTISEMPKQEASKTRLRILTLQQELESLIEEVEKEMESILMQNETIKRNYDLLSSIIGIGLVNALTTIVNTENFISFNEARQYACYVCVAPFEHTSGISINGRTKVSPIGDKQAKADLTQAAKAAIQFDKELNLYYNKKKQQGKQHGTIMNAVKFKLIERMFAVIKRGTPFVRMETFSNIVTTKN